MGLIPIQTWQVANEDPLTVLETSTREPLDNLNNILDSKLDFPFRLSLSDNILTVNSSEIQTLKSDGMGSTLDSFKVSTPLIQNQYVTFSESNLNFLNGNATGDIISSAPPSITSGTYIWLGLEAKSDGSIQLNWGNPAATILDASFPVYGSGTALCLILLQGMGGIWNFNNPDPDDIIIFKGDSSCSSGTADLVPIYKSFSQYSIQNTQGRYIRLNNRYFYTTSDIDLSFDVSLNQTKYICFDTSKTEGLADSSYIFETTLDPQSVAFPQHLVVLGQYTVVFGRVIQNNLIPYSTREMRSIVGDLVPSYLSNTQYRIQNSDGRKLKLTSKYFYLITDIIGTFNVSSSGTWYIYVNTTIADGGVIAPFYVSETQDNPSDVSFNPDYVVLGEYLVDSIGDVPLSGFIPYNVGSGGSGIGVEHFVPSYVNNTQFALRTTNGRKVKFNDIYFFLNTELNINYDLSNNGTWYICLDTSSPSGNVDSSYVVMTQNDPSSTTFDPYLAVLGEYQVLGGAFVSSSLNGYSIREMITWINGLPNIKSASDIQIASGYYTLYHNFGKTPSIVVYKYWDESAGVFIGYSRADIEVWLDDTAVYYFIPTNDPNIVFAPGDYFEIEAFLYSYPPQGGFASPKTDFTTDWFSYTPPTKINHTLYYRPQNISLEFFDNGIFYVEDGDPYVNKVSGGITGTSVTFDWTSLPALSVIKQMKIHLNVSKVSAGAFAADKFEAGVVTVTGLTSTVISFDLILDATNNNLAAVINTYGNNVRVLIKESITVSSEQEITISGLIWDMLPNAYIICATPVTSVIKLSGDNFEIETMRIVSQENITSALKLNANGIVKNMIVNQNAAAKTLVNAVEVTTGNVVLVEGRSFVTNGSITNKISDVDLNSEISVA